jgi:sulfate/thiosulfate transport system permease protein
MSAPSPLARYGMRGLALFYLAALLVIPLGMIFYRTFEDGLQGPIDALTSPDGIHAFWMTILCVGVAVPLNTIFGVLCALMLIRQRFRGKGLINSVIDLPFAVSPVVIGLSLFLIYGKDGFIGGPLADAGIQIIFSTPGLILATVFVSLPFVVREVMPVLQEIGTDQEQAAETLGASPWQTFWKVTLPSIRWGVTYGVVLATARALGEFGAVSVVSGKISGQTETLPLFVENEYTNFNLAGAYAAAIVLAILALVVLFSMNMLQRRARKSEGGDPNETPGTGVFVPSIQTGGSSASPAGPLASKEA